MFLLMIKINDVIQNILFKDEEALTALSNGYVNLSKYAKQIHEEVEEKSKKEVGIPGIVVALSRIAKNINSKHPLIQDVQIKNITTKSPLSEIVYRKTTESISKLSKVYDKIKTDTDDFFTMTLDGKSIRASRRDKDNLKALHIVSAFSCANGISLGQLIVDKKTNEITVICSDRIKVEIEKTLKEKPVMIVKNLASVGLSLDPKYYPMPNITFSLIRRIAQKRIPLAETITTRTEIIFVFEQKYLSEMVDLFIVKEI